LTRIKFWLKSLVLPLAIKYSEIVESAVKPEPL
jgi:hypothetical protein